MARSASREIDAKDDLNMLRLKSRKHELIIVVDDKFTLMVLQEYPGFWIEPHPPPPTPQTMTSSLIALMMKQHEFGHRKIQNC